MKNHQQNDILIVDPCLILKAGHAYHSALAVMKLAQDAGLSPYVLMSCAASDAGLPTDRWIPTFSSNCFNRKDWDDEEFESYRCHYKEQISRTIRSLRLSVVALVMPTADAALIAAAGDLIKEGTVSKQIAVVAWFLLAPDWIFGDRSQTGRAQIEEYQSAFELLRSRLVQPNRLSVFCEVEELSVRYSSSIGIPFKTLPCPNVLDIRSEQRLQNHINPMGIHVVMTGHAGSDKGYDIVAEAIRYVFKINSELHFTIHGVEKFSGNLDILSIFSDLSSIGDRVRTISTPLDTDEYYELMSSADLLMLPYRMSAYDNRGSGVCNEATRLGIPMIVPSGAQFAKLAIAQGRAIEISAHDSHALGVAILRAADNLGQLKTSAVLHADNENPDGRTGAVLAELLQKVSHDTIGVNFNKRSSNYFVSLRDSIVRIFR